jgi:hypothetical protein
MGVPLKTPLITILMKNTSLASVADLDPGSDGFLTPGSGMGKKIKNRRNSPLD